VVMSFTEIAEVWANSDSVNLHIRRVKHGKDI